MNVCKLERTLENFSKQSIFPRLGLLDILIKYSGIQAVIERNVVMASEFIVPAFNEADNDRNPSVELISSEVLASARLDDLRLGNVYPHAGKFLQLL